MTPDLTDLEHAYVAAATTGNLDEANRLEQLVDAEQAKKEARLASPTALLNAALWYATTLHLPVLPCTPGGKPPITQHGFKDSSTDPDQIRDWWAATPDANVGLPTGVMFDVFDVDGPEGVIAIGEYMDSDGFPPVLGLVFTPRGRHYYVPRTGRGNTTGLLTKVDYRGVGGYVIAPPSRTPNGRYRWHTPLTQDRVA